MRRREGRNRIRENGKREIGKEKMENEEKGRKE